jgi:hypothetical protein
MYDRIHWQADRIAIAAATLLIAALFLPWHQASVSVAGIVSVSATTSGWSAWGWVTAAFAVALVVVAGLLEPGQPGRAAALAGCGLALLVATLLAMVTGSASVVTAGGVVAASHSTAWGAWVGLLFAVVAAVAGAWPLIERAAEQHATTLHGVGR